MIPFEEEFYEEIGSFQWDIGLLRGPETSVMFGRVCGVSIRVVVPRRFDCWTGLRSYAVRGRSARSTSTKGQLSLSKTIGLTRYNKKKNSKKDDNDKSTKKEEFRCGEFGGLKRNPSLNMEMSSKLIQSIDSFDDLKLLPIVRDAIQNIVTQDTVAGDSKKDVIIPSPIQTLAVKRLSKQLMDPKLQIHAIAADTGSGKTMSYLIPMMDYLKREQLETPEYWATIENKAIIRSIILVPTHELVDQVHNTIVNTEQYLDLHTLKWDIYTKYPDLIDQIKNRVDILVTTPSKLLTLFNIKLISKPERLLSHVKFMVVDEADTLMDASWITETHKVIRKVRNINHLIFCSATIPNEFHKTLTKLFPSFIPITTPRLHKLPRRLDFKLIDASLNPFKGSKKKALAQILYAINKDDSEPGYQKHCIVFVNEKDEVPKIVENLKTKYALNVVGLTSENSVEERLETIKAFTASPQKLTNLKQETHSTTLKTEDELVIIPGSNITIGSAQNTNSKFNSKQTSTAIFLITTDLMARGLNFQGLRNVVLYDVPKTSIDLVHRAGRTARMRQGGRIFMITDKKTKSWAKALPKIIKKNVTIT